MSAFFVCKYLIVRITLFVWDGKDAFLSAVLSNYFCHSDKLYFVIMSKLYFVTLRNLYLSF